MKNLVETFEIPGCNHAVLATDESALLNTLAEHDIEHIAAEALAFLRASVPRHALIEMNRLSSNAEWDIDEELEHFIEYSDDIIEHRKLSAAGIEQINSIVAELLSDELDTSISTYVFHDLLDLAFEALDKVA